MQALAEMLPTVAQKQVGKGGFLVLRPDSGKSGSCCIYLGQVLFHGCLLCVINLASL